MNQNEINSADLDQSIDADITDTTTDTTTEPTASFDDLGLAPSIVSSVKAAGYTAPTPVQLQAIPAALAGGDLLVSSSTGSGKTAAFTLPALQRILQARGDNNKRREKGVVHGPRVLVLAPTRELALQVAKACETYGRHIQGLRVATVVGGVPYGAQLKALRGPLDVLIATPGRLIDHLESGAAVLSNVETLVLDEADRMLDMGFIDDIEAIASRLPEQRQTLMFSATFAGHVGRLAQRLTRDPQRIDIASHTDTHENIEQRLYWVDHTGHKHDLLDHFLNGREMDQAVIFTSTQLDADRLADRLADMGHHVAALHGGMPQGKRNRVLQGLRQGRLRVLVATDVAARGIDVPTITHVINYGLPMKAEDYVHRIGRTGRAGRQGLAVTLAGRDDHHMIRRIERFTTQRIPVAVVEGMEPTKPVPVDRPERKGGKFAKPMPGQRNRHREGGYGGQRFSDRAERFDRADRPQRHEGGDHSFGRGEGAPRFQPRDGGDFAPRERSFGDRPFGDRQGASRPHFGDRPSFGDRPHFKQQRDAGGRDFGGREQGPREGGQRSFGDNRFEPRGEQGFRGQGDFRPNREGRGPDQRPAFGDKPHGFKPGFKSEGFRPGPRAGKPTGGGDRGPGAGFKGKKPAGPRRSYE
ncbi:DEAD/DEAH box helicase [Aquabacterium sp.]|uniref:DEAD/DEAH box helicase n=1 Tax=Aquabacterium sp. TaxID=1872578 RepID=UPI0035ADF090